MTIEEQVVNKLIDRGFHISFAESCTGGLCCGTLVNVSNASKVLDMSFVTYANEAKVELINVNPETMTTRTMQFGNIGRNEVRAKSVDFVFNTLAELLEK